MELRKLSAAKLWLISEPVAGSGRDAPRDLPYLAHALYALVPVATTTVPRMTVDERWRVYVNPDWLDGVSVPIVGAELAHVTWHLLSEHADRARDQDVDARTAHLWHCAADTAIAPTLGQDELTLPSLATAASAACPAGLSAEEYYAIISGLPVTSGLDAGDPGEDAAELGVGCGSGADGLARGHELPADADVGVVDRAHAAEIRRQVAIEYDEHCRVRGHEPGDALRWAWRVLEPTVDWQPVLSGAVRRAVGWAAGRGEQTYRRPSRRTGSVRGVVLPGQQRPLPRIAVVVDTSASVDDELLGQALGEIDGALRSIGVSGAEVTVLSVDAAAHTAQRVRRARDAVLIGAGGTDMRVGISTAAAERPRPDVVIVLTDGDTPWPAAPPPACTVVAAILGRRREDLPPTPRWAVRVECIPDHHRRI